jgi:hypothetical protein
MALSEREERAFLELVAQLRPEAAPPAGATRRGAGAVGLAPSIAAVLAGVALVVAARQEWLVERLSFVSGFSGPSIALAFAVAGAALLVAAAIAVRWARASSSRPAAPRPDSPFREQRVVP